MHWKNKLKLILHSSSLSLLLSLNLFGFNHAGVCTNATAPSVSSINRILRNRAAERAAAEFARAAGYGLYPPNPYSSFAWPGTAHLWSPGKLIIRYKYSSRSIHLYVTCWLKVWQFYFALHGMCGAIISIILTCYSINGFFSHQKQVLVSQVFHRVRLHQGRHVHRAQVATIHLAHPMAVV